MKLKALITSLNQLNLQGLYFEESTYKNIYIIIN